MKFKKMVSLLMAVITVFTITIPSFSATRNDNIISPMYAYISESLVDIYYDGELVYCSDYVSVQQSCTVKVTLTLQRSSNNSSWSNHYNFSTMSATISDDKLFEKNTSSISHGYYYRTKAYVEIYRNNVRVETSTEYSSSIFIP